MPLTEEEAALIRSVVASPDDDTPRLVYADWLDEHGRADRARLIRVQCQSEVLRAEEQALLDGHYREWGGELYDYGADSWIFHRGFPEEITIHLDHFLETHADLNALTPLRRLTLTCANDDELAELAALPVLKQVRALELGQPAPRADMTAASYGPEGVRSLAASPHLSGLQKLSLHSHHVGLEGAQLVAGAAAFGNLTHLALTDPHLLECPSDVLPRLIASPALKTLVELRWGEDAPSYALAVSRNLSAPPRSSRE